MVSIRPADTHDSPDDEMDVDAMVVQHVCTSYGFVPLVSDETELSGVNVVAAVIYHMSGTTLDGQPTSGVIAIPIPELIEFTTEAIKDIAQTYCGIINNIQNGTRPTFVPLVRPMDETEFNDGIERLINGDPDVGKEPT